MEYLSESIKGNGCSEEFIILDKLNEIYKYSLSNNLNCIKDAVKKRTGQIIDTSKARWKINPSLSENVKKVMNARNVDYSMTIVKNKKVNHIIINMRAGNDKWLIAGFEEISNEYYCLSLIESFILFSKIFGSDIPDYD